MRVIAVDLDGTLAKAGLPVIHTVAAVNRLYEQKDTIIIIHTSRNETIRERTVEYLKQLGVNYHLLVMGKLRADVYVDDRMMSIKDFEALE